MESDHTAEEWLPVRTPDLGLMSGLLAQRRARLWALVLESRFVPFRLVPGLVGSRLLVPAAFADRAREELRIFEEENRNWPPPPPAPRPLAENTLATLSVLVLLATFHNVVSLGGALFDGLAPDWKELGSADAARILDGEWWRLVTALTLHADWLHLLGNVAIGGVFIFWLCRQLGSGLGWFLLLLSGVLGNLANACFQSPDHSSIGASTAVFGAVGILASLRLVRDRREERRKFPAPAAAGLALLALLGVEGKNTDVGAHLFGFLFGLGLGLAAEYLLRDRSRPGPVVNALLALISAAAVVAAWWAAVTFPSFPFS